MKKIPTLFERDWNGDRSRVLDQVHAGCEWVLAGEGQPTQKIDGTSCMIDEHGALWKRREYRKGQLPDAAFLPEDHDEETGKTVGWMPVGNGPEDRYHREAMQRWIDAYGNGRRGYTLELVGPKIQGNPEGYEQHILIPHDSAMLDVELRFNSIVPRDFEGLREWFTDKDIEGIVWHHDDGRMAKIKKRDFGLKRELRNKAA